MNKLRRKAIRDIIAKLQLIGDKDALGDCISDLENVLDDESEYFENIPENLQSSQRAMDSEDAIGTLEDVLDELNNAYDSDDAEDWNNAAEYACDELAAIA
jgi:hypothetical protein